MATVADILSSFQMPARPYSPTPLSPADAIATAIYGAPSSDALPAWIPPDVRDSMLTQPSYAEGQAQGPRFTIQQDTLNPQLGDIHRLFRYGIQGNTVKGIERGHSGPLLGQAIREGYLPGGSNI